MNARPPSSVVLCVIHFIVLRVLLWKTQIMAETQSSVKEVIPDVGGNFALDDNVISG